MYLKALDHCHDPSLGLLVREANILYFYGADRREGRKIEENATALYTVPLSQFKPPFSSISLCENELENITVAIYREGGVNP